MMKVSATLALLLSQRSWAAESAEGDSDCLLQTRGVFLEDEDKSMDGMELSNQFVAMADSLTAGVTKNMLRSFRICGGCSQWHRFGEEHDGGYLSCMDNMHKGDIHGAYSMGIRDHDQWSEDIFKKFKIPIYQYDCTVDKPAAACPKCEFFQVCLKGEDGLGGIPDKKSWTLREALAKTDNKHAAPGSLLLKIDIDGGEWSTLRTARDQDLQKFRQLIIEFHNLEDESRHEEYLLTLRHLEKAGFRVVHLHGNSFSGVYRKGAYAIPSVIEVTMDSKAQELTTCKSKEQKLPLDANNRPHGHKADVPLAHLPR